MGHRGETLFPGVGVTLGGGLSIHVEGHMTHGAHLQYQPFVSHPLYLGSLKVVKAKLNFGGWFNYLVIFQAAEED